MKENRKCGIEIVEWGKYLLGTLILLEYIISERKRMKRKEMGIADSKKGGNVQSILKM